MDTPLPLPETVNLALQIAQSTNQRVVLLTCGVSGSGKSTLSQAILTQYPNSIRLSIDAFIFEKYGVFGKGYKEEGYERLQEEARGWVSGKLLEVVREGMRDVVLDLSFWSKRSRDEYRELVQDEGKGKYGVELVVFRGSEEVIWRRLRRREENWEKEGMGEGRPVGRELFGRFLAGFEWPEGEGEIVVEVV